MVEERHFDIGDIVRHFKREFVTDNSSMYIYRIIAFAIHSENNERLVIYQGLYTPYKTCARPYEMFISKVDSEKYPNVKQKYRFEKVKTDMWPDCALSLEKTL